VSRAVSRLAVAHVLERTFGSQAGTRRAFPRPLPHKVGVDRFFIVVSSYAAVHDTWTEAVLDTLARCRSQDMNRAGNCGRIALALQ